MAQEENREPDLVALFLSTCGRKHLGDWLAREGNAKTLTLLLEFSTSAFHGGIRPWAGWTSIWRTGFNPMNKSLLSGRTGNIPLLLEFGIDPEFNESFYSRLQRSVVKDLVPREQHSACLLKIRLLRNCRRVFLVLLVLRTYRYSEQFPRYSKDRDQALTLIWRSIPDTTLCRHEIFDIFEGFEADFQMLRRASDHYGRLICEEEFSNFGQPRSLAHLSRWKVRQTMSCCRRLPYGVAKLPLPTKLKSYILLDQ